MGQTDFNAYAGIIDETANVAAGRPENSQPKSVWEQAFEAFFGQTKAEDLKPCTDDELAQARQDYMDLKNGQSAAPAAADKIGNAAAYEALMKFMGGDGKQVPAQAPAPESFFQSVMGTAGDLFSQQEQRGQVAQDASKGSAMAKAGQFALRLIMKGAGGNNSANLQQAGGSSVGNLLAGLMGGNNQQSSRNLGGLGALGALAGVMGGSGGNRQGSGNLGGGNALGALAGMMGGSSGNRQGSGNLGGGDALGALLGMATGGGSSNMSSMMNMFKIASKFM